MNENDILKIISNNRTENKNIDYKLTIKWGEKDSELDIIRDILAMSNTVDGGKIIIGIDDKTINIVGMPDEDFNLIDTTKIHNTLANYTEPKHYCGIHKFNIDGKNLIVIDVPEYLEVPIICKRTIQNSKNKTILQEGQIYIRTESGETKTVASSADVMREFLTRAVSKKSDDLLKNIKILITGKTNDPDDESESLYQYEIDEISKSDLNKKFDENVSKNGFWEVYAYPSIYNKYRIKSVSEVRKVVLESQVNQRNTFPHVDVYNNTTNGFESFELTEYTTDFEYCSTFQSGLFIWKGSFPEDFDNHYLKYKSKDFDKIKSIWETIPTVSEFILFFKRFYENTITDMNEDIFIRVILHNCNNRALGLFDPSRKIKSTICKTDKPLVIESTVKLIDLKTNYEDIVLERFLLPIFHIFNSDLEKHTIKYLQNEMKYNR